MIIMLARPNLFSDGLHRDRPGTGRKSRIFYMAERTIFRGRPQAEKPQPRISRIFQNYYYCRHLGRNVLSASDTNIHPFRIKWDFKIGILILVPPRSCGKHNSAPRSCNAPEASLDFTQHIEHSTCGVFYSSRSTSIKLSGTFDQTSLSQVSNIVSRFRLWRWRIEQQAV